MKNKHRIVPIVIFASIFTVIALIFTYLGADKTDDYYSNQLSMLYEQQLSSTVNSMIPIKYAFEDESYGDLDSLHLQMHECQTNLRMTALMIKNYESVINRNNDKFMYSLNPIAEHFEKYSELIANQITNGTNIEEFEKIFNDISAIQEMRLFSENKNSYEDIKENWNLIKENLSYKPDFLL